MASRWPRKLNQTVDLKFMTQITMFVLAHWLKFQTTLQPMTRAFVKIENSYLAGRQSPLCLLFAVHYRDFLFGRSKYQERGFLWLRFSMTLGLGIPSLSKPGTDNSLRWKTAAAVEQVLYSFWTLHCLVCEDMRQKAEDRLRDPASWLPLAATVSSRNLAFFSQVCSF